MERAYCATAAALTTADCARRSASSRPTTPSARSATSPSRRRDAELGPAFTSVPSQDASQGSAASSMAAETETIAPEALADFLRGVRVGVESGLDPLAAAQQAVAALPRGLRTAIEQV